MVQVIGGFDDIGVVDCPLAACKLGIAMLALYPRRIVLPKEISSRAYTVRAPFSAHGVPSAERKEESPKRTVNTVCIYSPHGYCEKLQRPLYVLISSYPLTGSLRSGPFSPPRLCCHYGYRRQAIITTTNPPPSYQPRRC